MFELKKIELSKKCQLSKKFELSKFDWIIYDDNEDGGVFGRRQFSLSRRER